MAALALLRLRCRLLVYYDYRNCRSLYLFFLCCLFLRPSVSAKYNLKMCVCGCMRASVYKYFIVVPNFQVLWRLYCTLQISDSYLHVRVHMFVTFIMKISNCEHQLFVQCTNIYTNYIYTILFLELFKSFTSYINLPFFLHREQFEIVH